MAGGADEQAKQRARGGRPAPKAIVPRDAERAALRRVLRQRRAALHEAEQSKASRAVAERLVGSELLAGSTVVAGYLAARGELDIDVALARLADEGMTVTVPRVNGDDLEFVRWKPDTMTAPGAFGIAEPVVGEVIPLGRHQAVLVPMVAFDHHGNRLGQGGGFYDRALAAVRTSAHAAQSDPSEQSPLVIGVAHSFARVHSIAAEPWDQRLDAAVTDRQIYDFRRIPPPSGARRIGRGAV